VGSPANAKAAKSPLHVPSARRALAGLCLSGLLASLLGAVLPAWGYHLTFEFATIGHYFLSFAAGVLLAVEAGRRLLPRKGVAFVLTMGCALACAALLFLAFAPPPIPAIWRAGGLVLAGLAMGLLNGGIFQAISAMYRDDPAATLNLGGIVFGGGCLLISLLIGGAFNNYAITSILIVAALVPALFTAFYMNTSFPPAEILHQPTFQEALSDLRSRGALLLALLLFFQFGNEWTIAGWLTIFLIQRLGASPEAALEILAAYWLALLLGRIASLAVLRRISHARVLMASAAAAVFGCLLLLSTNNQFGAIIGILTIGAGFAPIFPLVAEKIGHRFTYYHPGLFNGIFSFAMIGGMLPPWLLGYVVDTWGVGVVMAVPMIGTVMVFMLILLIWLESKIGG